MIIYCVEADQFQYCGDLKSAKQIAQIEANDDDRKVTVQRYNIDNTKSAIVDALNGRTGAGRVVFTAKPGKQVRI